MAVSLNTKVDAHDKGTWVGMSGKNGNVMVGDKAFEFYNDKNVEDFIQIPWTEISRIEASVWFKRKIPRFAIFVKDGRHFNFSCRNNKKILRACRNYVPNDRMLVSASFFGVLKNGVVALTHIFHKKK